MRLGHYFLIGAAALILTGCAGPENKLGRGISNMTEFARMGEIRRSIEQTAMWDRNASAFTTGFLRGFNRSMARTFIGVYEVVTFPIPSYDPLLAPKTTLYPDPSITTRTFPYGGLDLAVKPPQPDSYSPSLISGALFDTDTHLGFSGGDIAPMVPGSRFHIFDNQ